MFQAIVLVITAALVGLDQLTKYLTVANLKGADPLVLIDGVFEFTYLENRGAAFGMMQGARWWFVVFTSLVMVALLAVLLFGRYRRYQLFNVGLTLIIGGGIGNLIDRVANGFVVDMLHFEIAAIGFDFPVFNVADCYVVIGAILTLFFFFFIYDDKNDRKPVEVADDHHA